MSTPGVDHPMQDCEAEISTATRSLSVSARVESTGPAAVVVRPSAGDFVEQTVVRVGEPVSVFWMGPEGGRSLMAEVTTVERGAVPRWHLAVTSPAEETQRRTAVRARVSLPVVAAVNGVDLDGETLDFSEAGCRAVVEAYGNEPLPGARMGMTLELEGGALVTVAEVVRQHTRNSRWHLSLRFVDLPEKEQDRLRRRVFQALREERARQAAMASSD
ncbi:flagellar brake protein [Geodermatophilus sp. SYSU D00705]